MNSTSANLTNAGILTRWQVKETILVLIATMMMPLLVHLIPAGNGVMLGSMLLPLFYAPLVALILFRWHTALIAGVLAPVLNYLIMGHPLPEMVVQMCTEMLIFVLAANYLLRIRWTKFIAAPVAYLLAMAGAILVLSTFTDIATSGVWQIVKACWPGLLILSVITMVTLKIRKQ
ncbi:hypothetical protein EYV94_12400 [Puteibacter caeruleilacunae]|nr:hypothetical protein EYV94_12400 [Puteibacter caeruleilacunae]